MDTSQNDGLRTTENSFMILEETMAHDGASVTEIANSLDLSKSTIHEHLSTLEMLGYLIKEDDGYHVSLKFLHLGGYARDRQTLYRAARPEIDELSQETNETVHIVIEKDGRGIYLYQAKGDHAVQTDSHTGMRVYLHCTASGKALLAYLPDERVEEIIAEHGLRRRTSNTITDRETLFGELDQIQERGIAFDDEERIDGIRCVAVPIFDAEDRILGTLSVSGPSKHIYGDRYREEIPELIRRTTKIIEINTRYG